jgi:hypothetical protein
MVRYLGADEGWRDRLLRDQTLGWTHGGIWLHRVRSGHISLGTGGLSNPDICGHQLGHFWIFHSNRNSSNLHCYADSDTHQDDHADANQFGDTKTDRHQEIREIRSTGYSALAISQASWTLFFRRARFDFRLSPWVSSPTLRRRNGVRAAPEIFRDSASFTAA